MMGKITFIAAVIVISTCLMTGGVMARDPYIIHPLLGYHIDPVERQEYHLFPEIENFISASVYIEPDKSFTIEVQQWKGGEKEIIQRRIRKRDLAVINKFIANQNIKKYYNPVFEAKLHDPNFFQQMAGAAVGCALFGALAGYSLPYAIHQGDEGDILDRAIGFAAAGGAVGSTLGVTLASSGCYPHGPIWATSSGAVAGSIAGFLPGALLYNYFDESGFAGVLGYCIGQSAVTAIFYNMGRHENIKKMRASFEYRSHRAVEIGYLKPGIVPNPFSQTELMPKLEIVTLTFN